MANNKNQHFVPRCHLRPFTLNGEGKAIHLFNLDRHIGISAVPVKNQCSGDYFYGDNPLLDAAIRTVEEAYAVTLERLQGLGEAPTSMDRVALLRFTYLQYCRTEGASCRGAEIARMMTDIPGVKIDGRPETFRNAIRIAVIAAMQYYAESMRIIDDLKLCLLRNRTSVPFLTSDDPAILTNRWYQQNHRTQGLLYGTRNAGAVFLMPLTPALYCMFYDEDIYSINSRDGWVELKNPMDAGLLNEHQILNCTANLYFQDWEIRKEVADAVTAAAPSRPKARHLVHYALRDKQTDWGTRYTVKQREDLPEDEEVLVHIEDVKARPSAWPSFLRYRLKGKAYFNDTRAGYTRDWCLAAGFVTGANYRRIRVSQL